MVIKKNNFFKTGIIGFDELLGEGIPKGSSVLVEGGPGCGKTIFCLQTLYNACKRGEKGLYISFEESKERLISHMKDFGWDPKKYEKKGLLNIVEYDSLEIGSSVESLFYEAEEGSSRKKKSLLLLKKFNIKKLIPLIIPEKSKPNLLIVDSLSALEEAFAGRSGIFRMYLHLLFKYLEVNRITSFFIKELILPLPIRNYKEKEDITNFICDGIIRLYSVIDKYGKRSFAIEVYKMRGSNIKRKIVKMDILSNKGIVVSPTSIIGEALKGTFIY